MSKASYTFKWNTNKLSSLKSNVVKAMLKAGADTANKASSNAPVLSGALRNSVRVTTNNSDQVLVLAGGNAGGKTIAYARRREYENRKNPQTKRYMGRAFEALERNYMTYFKGITK